jgi:hypothetical protein
MSGFKDINQEVGRYWDERSHWAIALHPVKSAASAKTELSFTTLAICTPMKKVALLLIAAACGVFYARAATYYSTSSDPTLIGSWNTAANGSGTAPANFTTTGDVFIIGAGNAIALTSSWSLGAVTVNVLGTLNVSSTGALAGIASTTFVSGTGTITIAAASTVCSFTMSSPSSVSYTSLTGSQTIAEGTYHDLTLSNTSGTNTAANTIVVNGSLVATGGASGIFDMSTYRLGGSLTSITNPGIVRTANGNFTAPVPIGKAWPGTVEFNRSSGAQSIPAGTYTNLRSTNTSGINGASGALTINGAFAATGAASIIFTMNGNALSGTLTSITNPGTFRTSNTTAAPFPDGKTWPGTVQFFVSTGAQSIPAGTFNSLTLSNTSGTNTAGGNLTVNSTVTITNTGATLAMGSYTLAGSLATITNNGTITTANTSAAPLTTGKSWGGTVRFVGTGDQTIPAGTYTTLSSTNASTVRLGGLTTISGTTTVTNGVLDLNGYNLSTGALLTSATQTYGVFGAGIKTGANTVTVNSLPAGTTTVVPLITGQANDYSYVQLTPTNAVGWTFSLASTVTANDADKALQRTWNLSPVGNPGATTLKFSYNLGATGITSAAAGAWDGTGNVNVNHFNTTLNTWESMNGMTSYTPVFTLNNTPNASGTYYDVTVNGVTGFSPFAISQAGIVLPVTLAHFSGKREGSVNKLTWTTASESNNRGFAIQRSADGRTYSTVGFEATKAPNGSSSNTLHYSFADPATGSKTYYRLVQEDFDGKKKISTVISLKGDAISTFAISSLYPNPARSSLKLTLESAEAGSLLLIITDIAGRRVRSETRQVSAGVNALELNVASLSIGIYTIKAVNMISSESVITTFIKN